MWPWAHHAPSSDQKSSSKGFKSRERKMVTVGEPKERGVKTLGAVMSKARRCDPLKLRIKSYCKKEKITQAQYADLIGVSKTTVGRFMSGECGVGSE